MKNKVTFLTLFFVLALSMPTIYCVTPQAPLTIEQNNEQRFKTLEKIGNYAMICCAGLSAATFLLLVFNTKKQNTQIDQLNAHIHALEKYGEDVKKSSDELKKYYEIKEKNKDASDKIHIDAMNSMANDLKLMALDQEELNALSLDELQQQVKNKDKQLQDLELQQKLTHDQIDSITNNANFKTSQQGLEFAHRLLKANEELSNKIKQLP